MIFQSRDNTQTLSIDVSGTSGSAITGTIYAASAQLVDGGTTPLSGSLIVNLLAVSTGATADSLDTPDGGVAYTPAQVLSAYGINNLALDGTGQTIAIVDAYDDPDIFEAVDAFDNQFGLTGSGPTLYQPIWAGVVILDGAQSEWPIDLTARDRPERARHRQLGSGRVARRRVGPCHGPGRRSSWSRRTASRYPT